MIALYLFLAIFAGAWFQSWKLRMQASGCF